MRGVRKNRYREATRTLQSGVPDNLRGCGGVGPRIYPFRLSPLCQQAERDRTMNTNDRYYTVPLLYQVHRLRLRLQPLVTWTF